MTPRPALCVFDLDGTLVDSLRDIADSANYGLRLLGLAERPVSDFRYLVGEGVPRLCERLLGDSGHVYVKRLAELVGPYYRTRPLRHTLPYAGVPEAVAALRQRGRELAVLSNKPHEMTRRIVRAFWPADAFRFVQGYVREEHRKPDPFHLREFAGRMGVEPGAICLIGDTPTDVEAARRAGARSVGVTWGFRTRAELEEAGAELIVDRPEELVRLVG